MKRIIFSMLFLNVVFVNAETNFNEVVKNIKSYEEMVKKAFSFEKEKKYRESTILYKMALMDVFNRLNTGDLKLNSISSTSMSPTLIKGEQIVSIKTNVVSRNDIVIFDYPKKPKNKFIMRVVAKEGDIIMMKNKKLYLHPKEGNGYITKNYDKKNYIKAGDYLFIKEPYKIINTNINNDLNVKKDGVQPNKLFDFLPIQIEKDKIFVMGDNRDHSNDSRFFGSIKINNLYKPLFILNNNENYSRVGYSIK